MLVEITDGSGHATIADVVASALHAADHVADADGWLGLASDLDLAGITRECRNRVTVAWIRERVVTARPGTASSTAGWTTPVDDVPWWQYAAVHVGMFNSLDRMNDTLAGAGAAGWELVGGCDKASNWLTGFEKGFMLFKRPVPPEVVPDRWSYPIPS